MRIYSIIIFIFFSCDIKSQLTNDFVFILSENAVNKVFTAFGEIKGKSDYEVFGIIKGYYIWKIVNPKINFKADSSNFTCDAKIEIGPFNYKSKVIGHVKISYDDKVNKISIKIKDAIFELYTEVFKKKIHIKDIHLEDYFKDPFLFEGPKSFTTNFSVVMPDSSNKKIYMQSSDCVIKVVKQAIKTSCNINVQDLPFKK